MRVENPSLRIERAVVVGLGSLDPEAPQDRRRAARQLGLLLAVLESVAKLKGRVAVEGLGLAPAPGGGPVRTAAELREASVEHNLAWAERRIKSLSKWLEEADGKVLKGPDWEVAEAKRKVAAARRDLEASLAVVEAARAERRSASETKRAVERDAAWEGDREKGAAAVVPTAAQDPAFGPTDAAVLARFGVRCVGAPDAVREVGPDVLLFAPFMDVGVLIPHILRGARPGVYIGNNLVTILECLGQPDYAHA